MKKFYNLEPWLNTPKAGEGLSFWRFRSKLFRFRFRDTFLAHIFEASNFYLASVGNLLELKLYNSITG